MPEAKKSEGLERGLKNRHIQMIALGGCIGTGLFYGTAESIPLAGPAIILAYLLGGSIIYMIIRMMGEMATEEPVAGAFSHFAYKYWGGYPGFLAGWNYWFLYILVSMAELSVMGKYIHYWYGDMFPPWLVALAAILIITAINLVSVKFFGEAEFWLALIKVLAVVGMIGFGLFLIFQGVMDKESTVRVSNLWNFGLLSENGWHGVWISLVIVMFSFGGTELIGITAGEAENPQETIPRAVKQVMWRILIFYLGAIIIMLIMVPWTQMDPGKSPFVLVFDALGIPYVGGILNFVILTAAISVYNSGMYSNGRMLFGLAEQGNAPKFFMRLSSNKIPYIAVLFSSAVTLTAVAVNFAVPDGAFMIVMSVAIAAAVITWAMIVLVHLRFRKAMEGKNIKFKTPFYPVVNYICLVFLAIVIGAMTQFGNFKVAVYVAPAWILITFIGYKVKQSMDAKK
ncbi:MAG: amino acid permease [Saezia sp.]